MTNYTENNKKESIHNVVTCKQNTTDLPISIVRIESN